MTLPRWFRSLLSHFAPKKPRAPRRAKCICGHWWGRHGRFGCRQCVAVESATPCRLNREGKFARRTLAAVKESA